MPHIHNEPGQIDFVVNVFVVYRDKVLLRLHDKRNIWLMPGGHVELNEVPEQAAVREVYEEVGLEVKLYNPTQLPLLAREADPESIPTTFEGYKELLPPVYMEIHNYSETHRHIGLVYFATASTDQVVEREGREKSGGILWLSKDELEAHSEINDQMKKYGLKALELLGS